MVDVNEDTDACERLEADFRSLNLAPLWTQTGNLMPPTPRPAARAHTWRWGEIFAVAERAGALVPVGRGGERRAIALANPGLEGAPFATATLWAAVQYLGPHELAPCHRHTQTAFRFVLQGEGVWTVVDGDAVEMRTGDILLTPNMSWHEHQNTSDEPMVWLDGLDIPLVRALDAGFFEPGPDTLTNAATPSSSRSEQIWGHAGLLPLTEMPRRASSPLVVYRWPTTDAALRAQLELNRPEPSLLEPGHAAVRLVNPVHGGDALTTLRLEVHRLAPGGTIAPTRRVGSAVWQVISGSVAARVAGEAVTLERGDLLAVPSWHELAAESATGADLFVFSDGPVYEALGLTRRQSDAG